jgi:hypothetical protein
MTQPELPYIGTVKVMITWFIVKDMSHSKNTRDDECYDLMICIWPLIKMRGMTSETRGKDNVS